MKLASYTLADLRARLGEQAFWQRAPSAMPRVRALAHLANPRAKDADVALVTAERDGRVLGYIGGLPDQLHATEPPSHFAWTCAWWVAPEARDTGVGALLLFRLLKSHGHALGVSSYSVRAARFLEASRDFMVLRELDGLHIQCGARRDDLPGRVRIRPRAARLAELALPAVNSVGAQRLRAWLGRHAAVSDAVTVEYVNAVDPETAALVERHNARDLYRRGPAELDWLLQHPWHLEGKLPDRSAPDYHFAKTCWQFRIDGVKVFVDGRLAGFLVLTLRDGMLTVPYAYCVSADALALLTVVVRHVLADHVAVLELFEEELVAAARAADLVGLRRRAITRRSLISSRLRSVDLAGRRMRAGDGDRAFF